MHKAYRIKGDGIYRLPESHPLAKSEYWIDKVDELRRDGDGTYTKVGPGIMVTGIEIPDELVEEYTEERRWVL